MPLLEIPPPFHAIITSSSNMLHASSMINHFKYSIEFNHTSSIQWLWHEIHMSHVLFNAEQHIWGRT
jgi:hypothetical protein